MRRREFIGVLGGATAWPLAASAQQGERMRRIAVLNPLANDAEGRCRVETFQQGLRALGWIEGRNILSEIRWAAGDVGRMSAYARDLVATKPEVMWAVATPAVQALREATNTIPIVFTNVGDPTESGIVESLARPGAHITGITSFIHSMGGKWLELLKEIMPSAVSVLVILNPHNPTSRGVLRTIEAAAPSLGMNVVQAGVHSADDIEHTINEFV